MDRVDRTTIATALGGFGSAVASVTLPLAYPDAPPIIWQALFWIGVVLMGGSATYALYDHVLSPRLRGRTPSIPIAFKEIRSASFSNYPYTGAPSKQGEDPQPQILSYGTVSIVNVSADRPVSLEVYLSLTSDDGWNIRLPASSRDHFGRDAGKHSGIDARIAKLGIEDPIAFKNPISITPGATVTGKLLFLNNPWESEERDGFALRLANRKFREQLIIHDLASGVEITLPIPASYRGA